MRAGSLRERVTIQQSSVSADGLGASDGPVSWAAIATTPTVWARIAPLRGSERTEAMRLESVVSHEVTIRYRTDLTTAMRLSWGSTLLAIKAIYHDEKRRHTMLLCDEGAPS